MAMKFDEIDCHRRRLTNPPAMTPYPLIVVTDAPVELKPTDTPSVACLDECLMITEIYNFNNNIR